MVATAAPAQQFRHLALFYRGRDEYLKALSDFSRASRARGHAVFAAVPGRQAEQLRRRLGDDSAQVALTDMAELPPAYAEVLGYRDDLASVRGFVASRAEQAGLASSRASDLVLAVSELAANTVRHAGSDGTVRIWHTTAELICQVADRGQITDPLAWHRGRSERVLGGKGLWLVNQLCDLVQARTSPAGTVARLHMRLS